MKLEYVWSSDFVKITVPQRVASPANPISAAKSSVKCTIVRVGGRREAWIGYTQTISLKNLEVCAGHLHRLLLLPPAGIMSVI